MTAVTTQRHDAPTELDVFACPLDGVNQIEASAGTGKTWNICALYVRLLLEKDCKADEILVVTFTKAATAELHERIRSRLAQLDREIERAIAERDAENEAEQGDLDPFVSRLFETTLARDVMIFSYSRPSCHRLNRAGSLATSLASMGKAVCGRFSVSL